MRGMKTNMHNQVEQVDRIGLSLQATLVKNQGLMVVVGRDGQGRDVTMDLATLPHLLIGGSTGQGKSVFLHSLICSLVQNNSPEQVRFVLIDPKRVEFGVYAKLPHLYSPIVYESEQVVTMLKHVESEMDKRLDFFRLKGCRSIADFYKANAEARMSYLIVAIDEFSDFIVGPDGTFESTVSRIVAMGRSAGIHLVMATSRPDAKVVTGALKANIPGRLSFKVVSKADSRTLLGEVGAEELSGRGSALLKTSNGAIVHVQIPLIRDDEIRGAVDSVLARYFEGEPESKSGIDRDEALFDRALELIRTTGRASISHFQRQLDIGYNTAAWLMDKLEEREIVSSVTGPGAREIFWKNVR